MGVGSIGGGRVLEGDVTEERGLCFYPPLLWKLKRLRCFLCLWAMFSFSAAQDLLGHGPNTI